MPIGFLPSAGQLLPPLSFDLMISTIGTRIAWRKSHACPCVFAGGGMNGQLPLPGGSQPSCNTCLGLGVYWDEPVGPFIAWMKFVEMSPTPDEPGVRVDQTFGVAQLAEPSLTIPYQNPLLASGDPGQPTTVWNDASTYDAFIAYDMVARFTAKLQMGGIEFLPYQQNLTVAPSGAVTVWDTVADQIIQVSGYTVSGAMVTLPNTYAPGTNYMVEFKAAPTYIAFRPAGGVPHIRPFGGGTLNEPRRFKIQELDFWTRERTQGVSVLFPTIISVG